MDRSGRRTAVIVRAITAGVLFAGAATTAARAAADDRGTDASGSADVTSPHRKSSHASARTEAGTVSPTPGRGRGATTPEPGPVDPCPWWWPVGPAPIPPRDSPGGIVVGLPGVASVTPVPVFGDRRIVLGGAPEGDIGLSLPPLAPPESPLVGSPVAGSAPAAQEPTLPSALVAPSPVVPPAVPVTAAAPVGPPALTVPDLPAPGLVGPIPAASAARPATPQSPEPPVHLPELQPDDLGQIASSALPGLAALVGMTFLGGLIGFRQARAGYLLRAAGAGRFLQ